MKIVKRVAFLTPVVAFVLFVSGQNAVSAQPPRPTLVAGQTTHVAGEVIPNQFIVTLRSPGVAKTVLANPASVGKSYVGSYGGAVTYNYTALHGFALRLNPRTAREAVVAIKADPRVESIEPDVWVAANESSQTNAPWNLDRIDQRLLPLNGTYRYEGDGSGVRVYIIDSGIRTSHNEFRTWDSVNNQWVYRASLGVNLVTDLPDGDCLGHGTHVAGIAGGNTSGVAKGAQLISVRVLDCNGSAPTSRVIAGMNWVINNNPAGIRAVANLSLGCLGCGPGKAYTDAVNAMYNANITTVVSAGNNDFNACYAWPAAVPNAITVGATNADDTRGTIGGDTYSNFGPCVDLFAPGSNVVSAWITGDDQYATLSGTSMAAPHVAGVAALYLQSHTTATPAAVASAITRAATPNVVGNPGVGSPNRLLYNRLWGPGLGTGPYVNPVAADFDGDRKADLSVYRSDTGAWWIDYSSNGNGNWDAVVNGIPKGSGTHPAVADYDGDGKADISVKTDDQYWLIDYAANGFGSWDKSYYGYGNWAAHPVPADYDGDGKADLSVKCDDTRWLIDYAWNGFGGWDTIPMQYGDATAHPAPADYDGDGKADLSVKTDSQLWLIDLAASGFGTTNYWDRSYAEYGNWTAVPYPADYDGDGTADLSEYDTYDGRWLIDYARNGFGGWDAIYSSRGDSTNTRPVPADYDGDGKADISVYRTDTGAWWVDYASNGFGSWDSVFTGV